MRQAGWTLFGEEGGSSIASRLSAAAAAAAASINAAARRRRIIDSSWRGSEIVRNSIIREIENTALEQKRQAPWMGSSAESNNRSDNSFYHFSCFWLGFWQMSYAIFSKFVTRVRLVTL